MKEISDVTLYQQNYIRSLDKDFKFMTSTLNSRIDETKAIEDEHEREKKIKKLKGVKKVFKRLKMGDIQSHRTNNARIFNSAVSMDRKMRPGFSLNGHELVTVDCANSHPLLLCYNHRNDIEPELVEIATKGDFYEMFSDISLYPDRDAIKVGVYSCFYNKGGVNPKNPIYKRLKERYPKFAKVIMDISNNKDSGSLAKALQLMESRIWVDQISTALMFMGIKHATMHDSVVIAKRTSEEIATVFAMVEAVFGEMKPKLHYKNLKEESLERPNASVNEDELFRCLAMARARMNKETDNQDLKDYDNKWKATLLFFSFHDKKVDVQNADIIAYLTETGFYKIKTEGNLKKYARRDGSILFDCDIDDMKHALKTAIKTLPDRVFGYSRKTLENVFHKHREITDGVHFSFLPRLDDNMLRKTRPDTTTTGYVAFRNGVLKVTSEGKYLVPYKKYGGLVWNDTILQYDWEQVSTSDSVINKFLWNISGPKLSELNEAKDAMDEDRHVRLNEDKIAAHNAVRRALGYLCHLHKDPATTVMVVFMDENTGSPGLGGAGKSLTGELPRVLRKHKFIDASIENLTWQFDGVEMSHQVLLLDEMRPYYPMHSLNAHITGDFEVNNKGGGKYYIPRVNSPKLVGTSNYMIDLTKPGTDRRIHIHEINNHYSKELKPAEEFGKRLIDDWDRKEMMIEINYMVEGMQMYLEQGLRYKEIKDSDIKVLKLKLGEDVYDAMRDVISRLTKDAFYPTVELMLKLNDVLGYANYLPEKTKKFMIDLQLYLNIMKVNYVRGIETHGFAGERKRGLTIK